MDPLTTSASIQGLKLLVTALGRHSTTRISKAFKTWKVQQAAKNLYEQISIVCQVKTIYQPEKPVDLRSFFCPPKIATKCGPDEEQPKILARDASDFPSAQNIVVLGTAGQGKSILFRYLTSQEMAFGKVVPIFIELRRIQESQSLLEHLLQEMKSLGLPPDEEVLTALLEAGNVKLFLDGFDEVKVTEQQPLTTEIEQMVAALRRSKFS